jgi:hypothetical protein
LEVTLLLKIIKEKDNPSHGERLSPQPRLSYNLADKVKDVPIF